MTITEFSKKNKGQIVKYKKFLEESDWVSEKMTSFTEPFAHIKTADEKFSLQNTIVKAVVGRLKYFVTTFDGQWGQQNYKDFLFLCKSIIDLHLDRSESYINEFDITNYEKPTQQEREIEFQNDIFVQTSKIREELSGINLTDGEDVGTIEFYNNQVAPLVCHKEITALYPSVQKKLDEMGIDFKSEPKQTLHLLEKNPPEWDEKKHYYDQEPKVLQYYVDELKKINEGVYIDGVYISGWMYYQMNHAKASVPVAKFNKKSGISESEDVIQTPFLRDNEWFIINEEFERAKKSGEMMFIAATRRAGKSTMIASRVGCSVTMAKKTILLVSGSSKDLGQLEQKIEVDRMNVHPAFRAYSIKNDWEKEVVYGFRTKGGKRIASSTIKIVNLDGGADKKGEVLAGYTPDEVVIDEIMKVTFKKHLQALKPALDFSGGKRCTPILSGTAGDENLSKDAFDILREPTKNDILTMDWKAFNRRVPEEYRTWRERVFGTFIPAQMSQKEGMIKVKKPLSEFLGVESDILSKIEIATTDWENANRVIKEDREKVQDDIVLYTNEVLYYPTCPTDMLISGKINPFPVNEAKMHLEYLKSIKGKGKKVFLQEDEMGNITISMVNNELAAYPHKGGFIDAPVVLYEDLPKELPPNYLYVSGLDDYKQDESDTDSVGSFYVYKVDHSSLDKMSGKIVASIATRPDPHGKFHYQMYLLQRAFNAICFMENADTGYETYLQNLRVDHIWLKESMDFDGNLTIDNRSRRKYGWNPSNKKNKEKMLSLLVQYCKRVYVYEDENGDRKTKIGVQNIDDMGLLEEIIAYQDGKNVDRITAFMSALGYEFYLYVNQMFPDISKSIELKKERELKEIRSLREKKKMTTIFGKRSRKLF